jgi:hypothetical protein
MLAALMTIMLTGPAGADQGVAQIAGSAVPGDDTCIDPPAGFNDFVLDLSGDLDGCWYIDVEDGRYVDGSGMYFETGRERFVGCLDGGVCGTFDTTYRFTAKFADPELTQEIHGRCQHPITDGTGRGGFTGITGRVDFKDDVDTGIFHYRGHIRI